MVKKLISGLCGLGLIMVLSASLQSAGQHLGEQNMLDVQIIFSNSYGTTITNAAGTYYNFFGYTFYENKVYPSQYWGSFPLYFFGTQVGVTVKVTNKGPRAKSKIRVKSESYALLTNGSSGVALTDPKSIDVAVNKGETKTIDASFVAEYREGADSGLDRFVVKVLHINEGGGPGNSEPALIMQKEGIFCPPKYKK
ncbi:MAG: hypothetical protein AB1349_04030 [Elusimicrobiota bacterium]